MPARLDLRLAARRTARQVVFAFVLAACSPGGGLSIEEHAWCQQNFDRVNDVARTQGQPGVIHSDPASPVYVEACKAAYASR